MLDEIRARWADIGPWNDADHPVDEIYAAHFPRETAAVIAAPTDITYLLGENKRLTQLNEARKQLLVAYRTANPKLAERALTKIERLERIIAPQPDDAIAAEMTVEGSAHVTVRWELTEMYCFGGSYVPVYDCKACGNRAYGLSFHEMMGHLSAVHNDSNPTEAMRKAMFSIDQTPANVPALDSRPESGTNT